MEMKKITRKVLRSIIPPIFFSFKEDFSKMKNRCENWQTAIERCGSGYQDEMLNKFRIDRFKLNALDLKVDSLSLGLEHLIIALLKSKKNKPVIVDFGGALGEYGYILRQVVDKPFSYHVIENETLVRNVSADSYFHFANFSSTFPEECDIFFSSGTLQSIENPYEIAIRAFKMSAEFVVFARNCFSTERLFRVQASHLFENGSGVILPDGYELQTIYKYPHQTILEDKIHNIASDNNWDCLLSKYSNSGVISLTENMYDRNLFFVKREMP